MSKKRRLFSYLLSIALVISLFTTIVLTTLNFTLFSTVNVKKRIAASNYYEEVKNIIVESCKDYVMQSGFEESIMDNVVNTYDVQFDVDGLVDYIYEGKDFEVHSNMIRANLDKNINEYIANNKYVVNENTQKSINEFEDNIVKIYERNIEYSKDTVKQLSEKNRKIKKIIPIVMIVSGIISVILVLAIKEISTPSLGISALATGAILVFLKVYSGTTVAINNILLMNRAFSNTLISIANQIIHKLFIIGIILCVVGIAWIIYVEAKRKIVKMLLLDEHSQVIR